MDDDDADPLGSYGLKPLRLEDKPVFDLFFSTCGTRLSDYTFANTFIWRNSIHLRWQIFSDCLCVFANGDGGLTMLFPPVGPGNFPSAVRRCMDVCEAYNSAARLEHWTRVEYVSDELLRKFPGDFVAEEMSGDYVYSTASMIDLPGGDLASKRQARNRFARRYAARTERFEAGHIKPCMDILAVWQSHADQETDAGLGEREKALVNFKRSKEIAATADAMNHAPALGLTGMVLYADDKLAGFTLGEMLTADTCSILIEKTDRNYVGSAQYIFSEFCRQYWPHTTWCNVGDDWDIPSLAWTKESYRPAQRLHKWVARPTAVVAALSTMPAQADQLHLTPVTAHA